MEMANVHQAKTHLSRLLDATERGDEVFITRRGSGINRFSLVPVPTTNRLQLFGALRGQIHYADDYDSADAEILEMFDDR